MNQPFTGFGEAAKLFALHKSVVDEMEKAFKACVSAYLDAVEMRLREELPGLNLESDEPGRQRYWWTDTKDQPAGTGCPYVWVPNDDVRIITDSQLRAGVWADGASADLNEAVSADVRAVSWQSNCKPNPSGGWFAMDIGLGSDPIGAVAAPVALLLKTIRKAELGYLRHAGR